MDTSETRKVARHHGAGSSGALRRVLRRQLLASLLLVVITGTALAAPPRWQGRTLAAALDRLRERGLPIVYTGELVRPEMVVELERDGSATMT